MFILGYTGFTRDSRLGRNVRSPLGKVGQNFDSIFEFLDGEVPFSMFPLGYFGHDGAAALVRDGTVIACAAEERFTRVKHSLNLAGNTLLPKRATQYCLQEAGIKASDVNLVAHYCDFTQQRVQQRLESLKPFLSELEMGKVSESYNQVFEGMMSRKVVIDQFQAMSNVVPPAFVQVRHHCAHAASAFYPSGFADALILTLDGTGEVESSFIGIGHGRTITELRSCTLPTSLGGLYLIVTVYLGFKSLGDEYKVMGLAPFGDPRKYRDLFRELVTLNGDGTYTTPRLGSRDLRELLLKRLGPARSSAAEIQQRHADVAAALQDSVQTAVLHSLTHARKETGLCDLCMAGGVALNCTLNGVIAHSGLFRRVFVQPASSDEGCSVGAALYAHAMQGGLITPAAASWTHSYWGPAYSSAEIERTLEDFAGDVQWEKPARLATVVARELAGGRVVGWFQGRMEFGPRALGNRSILADPRDPGMKDRINNKVKSREAFRPFAPAVVEEEADYYFDMTGLSHSPFMLFTVPVLPHQRTVIPAVTHVDGSARVQTVSKATNPQFWELLREFQALTGVPVLLNTSYNGKDEPIVCSPKDALRCFLSTKLDCTALGEFFVTRRGPP
jgi:carbamoyltransferase